LIRTILIVDPEAREKRIREIETIETDRIRLMKNITSDSEFLGNDLSDVLSLIHKVFGCGAWGNGRAIRLLAKQSPHPEWQ
jgi:hypothetical protein